MTTIKMKNKIWYLVRFMFFKFYSVILLSTYSGIKINSNIIYFLQSVLILTPIAFLLESLKLWFFDNFEFINGTILIILINMLLGAYMHFKKKDFRWETFLKKTVLIIVATILVYVVLTIITSFSGDTIIAHTFKMVIQVSTLLYPGSKIIKNIHILTDGEHPPQFIMTRLYNFEKNGDLNALLKGNEEN